MSDKKMVSIDGNTAAGYIGYMMSEVAGIYPITPSSPMAEYGDELNAAGKKNIFGRLTKIVEMQSEAGAAGAVHGSLAAGALTTTYTASQGLLLMIPNMYKIAGEMLPSVFHVSARTIASHALNIFGDHSDVMACRQTGFLMLASNNVQEVMDMALISHVATYRASLPILHFFDGFRTSHEINKIEKVDDDLIKQMLPIKEIEEFKKRAHSPLHPKQTGTAQNPDIFFQNREACNKYYDQSYDVVEKTMDEFGKLTGRHYKPFMYEGASDAKFVVVAIGSGCDTIEEVVKYLVSKNKKVGVLKVHLYRPFNGDAFVKALPSSVKKIAVLDRTKEPGSVGEPLYEDVVTALKEASRNKILVSGGRYGLGGKDFTPEDALGIFDNLKLFSKQHFTTSINDDVTHASLNQGKLKNFNTGVYEMKFFGLGSDGTVSANKSSIKIVGDLTNKFVQGYFEYDSKKSGSLTTSHLRMSDTKFNSPYLVKNSDFIAIHNYAFIHQYDILAGLKKGGKVLLNTSMSEEQLAKDLPENFKDHLKQTKAQLFVIPAFDVAHRAGLGNRINVIMQACFFKIASIIPYEQAEASMKTFATKAYGKKGEAILNANMKAIESATTDLKEINTKKIIRTQSQPLVSNLKMSEYYKNFVNKINARHGDSMSVSEFDPSGTVPTGTTQYEKRGIGLNVPVWVPENCIQCGQCALVCPHAVIRSYLLSNDDAQKAKTMDLNSKPALGAQNANFAIQASPWDCTGCGACVNACIAKQKALVFKPFNDVAKKQNENWEFINSITQLPNPFNKATVKGVQFEKPYFEFSGACAGCGETPYVKLVSQLFGKQMVIANATGCSSIYGGSAPSCPYTVDQEGHGPSWANSLFEDNAEFGYGMRLAIDYQRDEVYSLLKELLVAGDVAQWTKDAINELIIVKDQTQSWIKSKKVIELLRNETNIIARQVLDRAEHLVNRSTWIIGGDGWAYDIGYGGLDHVIAQNENVNILVLDTEVYSNTGGQSSKSTPAGSIAKFAANGKTTRKKDLGLIAMSYKNVYVAQVAMGANPNQLIRALTEAESYNGPSLIIAYAPCINHGINLSLAQNEEKKAVETGYWTLYRYDPRNPNAPLTIDSVEPSKPYEEFLMGENRYVSLSKKNPDLAKKLFTESANQAKQRRETLLKMVKEQTSTPNQ